MSLSPRLIAIQGVEFTPIQIATQGLLDYIAGGGVTRRPKSTNTLKLQRIKDGRATALSAKALTRAHPARAKGDSPTPIIPSAPGHVLCVSARAGTVSRVLRAKGTASAVVSGSRSIGRGQVASTGAGAGTTCHGPRARMLAHQSTGHGAARAALLPFMSFSSHTEALTRGVQNLSDIQVAAAIRATIDIRR